MRGLVEGLRSTIEEFVGCGVVEVSLHNDFDHDTALFRWRTGYSDPHGGGELFIFATVPLEMAYLAGIAERIAKYFLSQRDAFIFSSRKELYG